MFFLSQKWEGEKEEKKKAGPVPCRGQMKREEGKKGFKL